MAGRAAASSTRGGGVSASASSQPSTPASAGCATIGAGGGCRGVVALLEAEALGGSALFGGLC